MTKVSQQPETTVKIKNGPDTSSSSATAFLMVRDIERKNLENDIADWKNAFILLLFAILENIIIQRDL